MNGLVVQDLTVAYGAGAYSLTAVSDVSFDVPAGVRLGLVGESGSGKTTTTLALLGLLNAPGRIAAGKARLDGDDMLALPERRRRRFRLRRSSYIPQGAMNALNPVLRIGEQFMGALADHEESTSRRTAGPRIERALADVGLPADVARRYPHQLSGGQKQRVCIALSTILGPRLVVADEPTSALDVVTQRQVMETLGAQQRALGSALLLIGHDIGLMTQFVDRLAVMYAGRIVEIGPIRPMIRESAHPYTRALVGSVPRLERRGHMVEVAGMAPSLRALPAGCAFHPRCPLASPRCEAERPVLRALPDGRLVACHLAGNVA